ncbi:alpha-amylase family protein [Vibrio navarrensis]|uniref:alpha-amylase family protein n=1 Tax=Vibrio navarrensis TaxID=29495 RepID=UPI00186A324F|nr:alpha-amylase family protein [Vibrio navarrensis]MBE4618140.1 alpha-amylase [Vibrio navarrensis]
MKKQKYSVYQVFTRLFGNQCARNQPWGTLEENGVGKFSDFNDDALAAIKQLGISHIWYTGVPHHALVRDYQAYGIDNDHPAVVKGRAGSPYAVKDYYSVNPDLADNPAERMAEFAALIERTHRHGMRVIIDIVPNHVARKYHGLNNPEGVRDFGADDDTSVEYHRDNNFYYIPGQAFQLPDIPAQFSPLGGEAHPQLAQPYEEFPAKWTGNGSRLAKPNFDDWYETVKVNYGVRPDGSKDFAELPADYAQRSFEEHFAFWQQQEVPSSWRKFRDITLFWLDFGVDGFRYDMAEMVPVEFWSYLNSHIKMRNRDAFLMAEVYQPHLYRDYIHLGKMDYLYDKVDLYDGLKAVIQGKASTAIIGEIQAKMMDIEHNMLHFLDNHDEQRLAHAQFAGDADYGRPAMLVSALLSSSPSMIYFGQEVGEAGNEHAGFGLPSRTSIFDYIGVPEHQKWMNNGLFDGGLLSDKQKALRAFYARLLNFSLDCPALCGEYMDLYPLNQRALGQHCHLFARFDQQTLVLAASNFSADLGNTCHVTLPEKLLSQLGLSDGSYTLSDAVGEQADIQLQVQQGQGDVWIELPPFAASAWVLQQ